MSFRYHKRYAYHGLGTTGLRRRTAIVVPIFKRSANFRVDFEWYSKIVINECHSKSTLQFGEHLKIGIRMTTYAVCKHLCSGTGVPVPGSPPPSLPTP